MPNQDNNHSSSSAWKKLGISALGAATVFGSGLVFNKEVPEGSIGLKNRADDLETTPGFSVVESGNYWFGALRFPNLTIVRPGQNVSISSQAILTPGTISKIVSESQDSLLARSLPVVGDHIKAASTKHLNVSYQIEFKFPERSELASLAAHVSGAQFELDFVNAANLALANREDRLNRKWFKPNPDKINDEIGFEIARATGLEKVDFQVRKIERFTRTDKDHAAERDATRRLMDDVVEVLFDFALLGVK